MDEHAYPPTPAVRESSVLVAMASYRAAHCVTIYLPVEQEPWADEQNFARMREALRRASQLLQCRGPGPGEAEAILTSAWTLHDAASLWSDPGQGLALFLAADRLLAYRMPHRPQPQVVVDDHFYLQPFTDALDGQVEASDSN